MPYPKPAVQQHPGRPSKKAANDSNPMARHHFDDVHHAIQHFFSFYDLPEAKELLHTLYHAWLVSGKAASPTGQERDSIIFFYEQLCIVLEASYLLQQERIRNGAMCHCIIGHEANAAS